MSKAYSADLIDLIKSLSPVEKAYIKKFAFRSSSKGNQLYLGLFNNIDRQKEYNEKLILKNSKYSGQFPQLKKYLYSAICKALDSYHAESSPRLQLIKMISMIEILYKKGLESQCRKLIENAKKRARAYELYQYLIELSQWEKALSSENISEKEWDKIYEEQQEHLKTFKIICDYNHLNHKVGVVARNNYSKRPMNELAGHETFLYHPLFKSDKPPVSLKAKMQFFETKATYFEITGDFLKSYYHRKESLLLFENFPEKKLEDSKSYLITLNNYFMSLIKLKKYQEIEECITFIRSIPKFQLNNVSIRYGMFLIYSNELDFYLLRGEFERGVNLVKKIESDLKQHQEAIPKGIELLLSINCAIVYFGVGNFSSTLSWLNRIMINDSSNLRNDIVCFARILNLITHFELGNIEMLEYTVKSTYRFLYKRGGLYKFETVILNFIKHKIPRSFNNKELKQAFIELKGALEEIVKDPLEQEVLESFDLICWLESKIKNRAFGEIFREKVKLN